MNQNDQDLAHKLKIKFGTAPMDPNAGQLAKIKADIQLISSQGRVPTEKELATIVARHCPGTGQYIYKGADNSDLITLLQLAKKTS